MRQDFVKRATEVAAKYGLTLPEVRRGGVRSLCWMIDLHQPTCGDSQQLPGLPRSASHDRR
jgi:hypothetical protein